MLLNIVKFKRFHFPILVPKMEEVSTTPLSHAKSNNLAIGMSSRTPRNSEFILPPIGENEFINGNANKKNNNGGSF